MQYSTHAAIYSSFICNACFFSIISSLSCLQLVRHIFLLLSERREKPTGTCWSYQCFPFIYHPLSFALFLSKASQSSLCVLFPLQQCVALVITSCLKQTDGITESDGQFSQCLFSPCMCTQPPFCVCVCFVGILLYLPPPLLPHPCSHAHSQWAWLMCVVWVCAQGTWGITWQDVLAEDGSGTVSSPALVLAIWDARCHSGPLRRPQEGSPLSPSLLLRFFL